MIVAWQGLGYNRRAVSLHRAAQHVAAHGWPDDLTELPGVGPYTAAAVGNFAFGRDVLPVDTNVQRVQERTGELFDGACAQALFDLGATICLARIPRCGDCPLAARVPGAGAALRAAAQAVEVRRLVPRSGGRSRCAPSQPASSRRTARRSSRSSATASSSCTTGAVTLPS